MSEEQKEEQKIGYRRNRCRNITENEKNKLKEYQWNYWALKYHFLYSIKMSDKTLKFSNVGVNEK